MSFDCSSSRSGVEVLTVKSTRDRRDDAEHLSLKPCLGGCFVRGGDRGFEIVSAKGNDAGGNLLDGARVIACLRQPALAVECSQSFFIIRNDEEPAARRNKIGITAELHFG